MIAILIKIAAFGIWWFQDYFPSVTTASVVTEWRKGECKE
jgi:hypothetical protein